MAHLRDIQLIEHCQGGLSDRQRAEVDAHLAGCDDCARRHRQMHETWQALGAWTVDPAGLDLASRVLAEVTAETGQEDESVQGPYRLHDWVWPMTKIAASVGLAAVLGYVVGIAARPAPTGMYATDADPQLAAEELYLDILTDASPVGLTPVILTPETPDEEV